MSSVTSQGPDGPLYMLLADGDVRQIAKFKEWAVVGMKFSKMLSRRHNRHSKFDGVQHDRA